MNKEFYRELGELIKKHELTLVTGQGKDLNHFSDKMEGMTFFITNGEKKKPLGLGNHMIYESSVNIRLSKNRS